MRRGMHPDGQDIFVEVDWMTGHRMEETAQNLVIRAFGRHDDGWGYINPSIVQYCGNDEDC